MIFLKNKFYESDARTTKINNNIITCNYLKLYYVPLNECTHKLCCLYYLFTVCFAVSEISRKLVGSLVKKLLLSKICIQFSICRGVAENLLNFFGKTHFVCHLYYYLRFKFL